MDIKISCTDDKTMLAIPREIYINSGPGYHFSLKPLYLEIQEKQKQLQKDQTGVIACVRKRLVRYPVQEEDSNELKEESYPFSLQEIVYLQLYDKEIRILKNSVVRNEKENCPDQLKFIFEKFSIIG